MNKVKLILLKDVIQFKNDRILAYIRHKQCEHYARYGKNLDAVKIAEDLMLAEIDRRLQE